MLLKIPVSIGEVFDKISILFIKCKYLKNPNQVNNVKKEMKFLLNELDAKKIDFPKNGLYDELLIINEELWHIENEKRIHMKNNDFGLSFIVLAKKVVEKNDQRALIKNQINLEYGSEIIEEKSHENTKL